MWYVIVVFRSQCKVGSFADTLIFICTAVYTESKYWLQTEIGISLTVGILYWFTNAAVLIITSPVLYIPNKSPVNLPNFRPNEKCLSDYIGL